MCAPALIAVGLGGMKAITGIQEQNRAHAAQVAAVNRSNTMARQKYINELNIAQRDDELKGRKYEAELKAAAAEKTAFMKQKEINQISATQASTAEQMKLQEKITAAQFQSQENLTKSIQAQGTVLASGQQAGQSLMLTLDQAERELGFEQAQIDASIFDATRAFGIAQYGIDLDQYSADTQTYNSMKGGPSLAPSASFAPVVPIKKKAPAKPSALGPILSGVTTGLSTFGDVGGDWEAVWNR